MSFIPPYPVPHRSKASLFRRFLSGWTSWIHTLFERSYTMKMGEIHLPKLDFYIANDLAIVDEVLDDRQHRYPKHEFLQQLLGPLLGNSVLTANGTDWEHQREMVNPGFSHTNLKRVFPLMKAGVDDLIAHMRTLDHGKPISVEPLMTRVAADIIYRTLFSLKLSPADADFIYHAFDRFQKQVQPSAILSIYGLPLFGYKRRAIRAAQEIHAVFAPIITARFTAFHERGECGAPDILQTLLEQHHPETGAPFSLPQLIDQVSTIFFAGHETAASAMSWALYLLAECPDLQAALRKEIYRETGGEAISFESIRGMDGVRNLFRETLRLYPPISFFVRAVTRPTVMREKPIAPGGMLVISPWLIQRNSDNFPCPHAFDPDRFDDPEQAEACRRAYMPFGKGPRICVGAGFAQQESMIILAEIIRAFTLSCPQGPKPEPVSRLTLRSRHGIFLTLAPN